MQSETNFLYLAFLIISLLGLIGIDHRHKLALFRNRVATLASVSVAVVVFLIWDIIGISLGIFFRGTTPFLSGFHLAPELPIEELLFLILLSYNTLLAYQFFAAKGSK
jgi:lycopene cyclase domain-containing protein